jgi:hypothetical protein
MKARQSYILRLAGAAVMCVLLTSCSSSSDDSDDDSDQDLDDFADDSGDDAPCNVSSDNMIDVDASADGGGCAALGISIEGETALVNMMMTVYQVQGQYSISSADVYYLRGKGDVAGEVCFDKISGSGDFSVWISFSECTEEFQLDVVATPEEDAASLCSVSVDPEVTCGQDDDADDAGDDIDDSDDVADDDGVTPILTDGGWNPGTFTWTDDCGDSSATEPCSTLLWYVCDPDDNMLPDGVFYIYQAGTANPFFAGGPEMYASDFSFPSTPDFTDCSAPVDFGIGLLITEDAFSGAGTYSVSCDIEAEDSDGNFSNKLTDLQLDIVYMGY